MASGRKEGAKVGESSHTHKDWVKRRGSIQTQQEIENRHHLVLAARMPFLRVLTCIYRVSRP